MAKNKATGPKGVNWPALRVEYVASDGLSLEALAKEHGIAATTVKLQSAAESWPKLRLERQDEDAAETLRKLRLKLRRELVERTEYHLTGIRAGLARLLDEIARGKRTGRTVKDPKTGEQVEEREPLNAGSLDKATLASERMVKAERALLGEADVVVENRMSDEDRQQIVADLMQAVRDEGDPAEVAARARERGLELLGEEEREAS